MPTAPPPAPVSSIYNSPNPIPHSPDIGYPGDFKHPASADHEPQSSTLTRQHLAESFAALAKLCASPAIGQTGGTLSCVSETAHFANLVTDTTSSQSDLTFMLAGL